MTPSTNFLTIPDHFRGNFFWQKNSDEDDGGEGVDRGDEVEGDEGEGDGGGGGREEEEEGKDVTIAGRPTEKVR